MIFEDLQHSCGSLVAIFNFFSYEVTSKRIARYLDFCWCVYRPQREGRVNLLLGKKQATLLSWWWQQHRRLEHGRKKTGGEELLSFLSSVVDKSGLEPFLTYQGLTKSHCRNTWRTIVFPFLLFHLFNFLCGPRIPETDKLESPRGHGEEMMKGVPVLRAGGNSRKKLFWRKVG